MTKAQKRAYYAQKFIHAECMSVEHYYNKCSDTKISIEQSIKRQMLDRNGKRYRILSGSAQYFVCAYAYPKEDKWILVVETPGKHLEYDLIDEEVHLLCL